MLNLLSWNLNGMGKASKCKWVKDLVKAKNISLLCLQETKTAIKFDWQVKSVWGKRSTEFAAIDLSGNSSGILTVWDGNLFKVQNSCNMDGYVLICGLWLEKNSKLGVINVYAPQDNFSKRRLWEQIREEIQKEPDAAWVVCGDFNEVRGGDDRKGSILDRNGAKHFNDFIALVELHDLRIGGRRFTWMNSSCSKISKLDRYLVNQRFLDIWPLANVIALPRVLSDHCPILSSEFGALVTEKWNANPSGFVSSTKIDNLSRKLKHLKMPIKKWSMERRKQDETDLQTLKSKISSIDLRAEISPLDDSLVKERVELVAKADDILSKKVSDIMQKAKCKWLREGDENLRYFHGCANKKLKNGRIHGLNINGSWETNPMPIKYAVWDFFDRKFAENHPVRPTICSRVFKKLSTEQKEGLEVPFTEQEIKKAVWSCGYNKASGPDGFTIEFVRKFWDVVGNDFVEAIKFFEQHKQIDPGSNSSFISLIPKISDPLFLSDYRPINLIGCVNKVISKVLAERLKLVLDSVISNSQTAYIKRRSILDGPLMAFDSLNWNFLDNVYMQMGFGDKWRAWMRGCFSTAKVSVIVNGSPTKEFTMGKGVRQGDPLVPFLFILAAEGLTVAMKEAQQASIFRGVRFNNSEEDVSIFQFVDDAIFVGEWSLYNAKNLLRVLKCFEVCSGLQINLGKSRLLGVSVSRDEVTWMARRLNCKEESIPFRYLGLPTNSSLNNPTGNLKRFQSEAEACLANRFWVVINQLESIRRRFLWGGNTDVKRICWVAWDKVIRDKHNGGLGIGSLRALNLALLMKWRWREKTEPYAIWNKVVQSCAGRSRSGSVLNYNRGTWKSIVGVEKDLRELGINVWNFLKLKEDGSGWIWELDSSKKFTVKSLRRLIDGVMLPTSEAETEWIRCVPSRFNIFLWRTILNRLPTKDNLLKRGMVMQNDECSFSVANLGYKCTGVQHNRLCSFCHSCPETLKHLMITCSTAKIISAHLASWKGGIEVITSGRLQSDWGSTVWKTRNNKIFKGELKNEKEVVREIQTIAFNWVRCRFKRGDLLSWDNWLYNLVSAVASCIALASR
ncbi:hypothetical protein OSB04_004301 [Centaurea solstitialis]|uniref:Reverse transcriptase domain-containing protein n=1 Tax=Centaurea solstitialis TaxID=347529 RepID=A0AA38TWJ5_9ASTR|nr:hypothetical protein OSB04_004301 [Centaurea solstitialis]